MSSGEIPQEKIEDNKAQNDELKPRTFHNEFRLKELLVQHFAARNR